jgi:hypothetical protein
MRCIGAALRLKLLYESHKIRGCHQASDTHSIHTRTHPHTHPHTHTHTHTHVCMSTCMSTYWSLQSDPAAPICKTTRRASKVQTTPTFEIHCACNASTLPALPMHCLCRHTAYALPIHCRFLFTVYALSMHAFAVSLQCLCAASALPRHCLCTA